MVILNQKPKGCIFRSQNASLSVRHFNAYHQSLIFYKYWRKPHLLVCSLLETLFFFLPLWGNEDAGMNAENAFLFSLYFSSFTAVIE